MFLKVYTQGLPRFLLRTFHEGNKRFVSLGDLLQSVFPTCLHSGQLRERGGVNVKLLFYFILKNYLGGNFKKKNTLKPEVLTPGELKPGTCWTQPLPSAWPREREEKANPLVRKKPLAANHRLFRLCFSTVSSSSASVVQCCALQRYLTIQAQRFRMADFSMPSP